MAIGRTCPERSIEAQSVSSIFYALVREGFLFLLSVGDPLGSINLIRNFPAQRI